VAGAITSWGLGLAWGGLLATPLARRALVAPTRSRVSVLASGSPPVRRAASVVAAPIRMISSLTHLDRLIDLVAPVTRLLFGHRRARAQELALVRELPVVLDLLGVAVAAGCTPYLAVEVAARWSPPVVASSFTAVLRACALGAGFGDALGVAADAAPRLRPLTDALLASDRLGAPVAPVLSRLAAEERSALRRRAEAHARRVPVRLLFPLVFLVLPAFVLLTVVPGLAAGLGRL
jgi:hypothetical protein